MTTFDKREHAFEGKFAHDEKMGFDAEARASKLYGLWAAEKLGLIGADAETYAKKIVAVNLEEPGFEDVLRAVQKDFKDKDLDISDHVMRVELDKAIAEAKQQIIG